MPPRSEMIDCLYNLHQNGRDDGVIGELVGDFCKTTRGGIKPDQVIIVFRDGVSESQFDQVLNIELVHICKAFNHFTGGAELPKITLIVAERNHHTQFFQKGTFEDAPAGTVVDTCLVHPRKYDFYMYAHAGSIGSSRPTHYHVLMDQIGFSPDNLQELVHSLSYDYQKSTSAISIVSPIRYAQHAAARVRHLKLDPTPELPRFHPSLKNKLFF